MPSKVTTDVLMELLRLQGLKERVDFVHAPADFRTRKGFGYGFVNFVSEEEARQGMRSLDGYDRWERIGAAPSSLACIASWSEQNRGLSSNIERYRNSPVMHPDVPEMFKPRLLHQGRAQPFPAPTRALRPPRQLARLDAAARDTEAFAELE